MGEFLHFARLMIRDRALLVAAMIFALLAAAGFGIGLMSMIPIIKLIVDPDEVGSLPAFAERFNEGDHAFLGYEIDIPQWMIDIVPDGRVEGVIFIVVFVSILTVIAATFNFLHQYLSITVATRAIARARHLSFRTAIYMPLTRVSSRGASEFVARIIRDTAELHRGLIALMSKSVAESTHGLAAFTVAIIAGERLTLAALILVPVLYIILRKLGKRIRRGTRGALQGQEQLLRLAIETVQGLRAVKSNTGEDAAIAHFDELNAQVIRQELRARIARALASPVTETIAIILVGVLAIFAAREIIAGRLSIDRFVLALGGLAYAASKFKMMAGLINEMQAASAPARRILDVLHEPLEEEEDRSRPALAPPRRRIAIEGVSLTYPGQIQPALRAIDLEIEHGERIAIVGPNGCGKTTLISLLPRLVRADKGRVLIDGTDIATVSLSSLRRQIGVVTQETILFRGTIADNISFGKGDVTREQIIEAAKRAYADEFISNIPGGYDADVSEQGASLSGGQRQRLAIARAFLRNPSILILDEATSQIDAESEALINQALREFCTGRTAITVAHRLATVLTADRIIVMNRGRIVDQGTHNELLARCELYRRLTKTQLVAAG